MQKFIHTFIIKNFPLAMQARVNTGTNTINVFIYYLTATLSVVIATLSQIYI